MNYPIRTNKLLCDINYQKLKEKYAIFKIKYDGKLNKTVYFLDQLLVSPIILGVKNAYHEATYILCDKTKNYESELRGVLNQCEEKEKLSYDEVNPENIDKFILLQLFINSLARSSIEMLGFNNLGGHLYVTVPSKCNKTKITTVEILIDKDGYLTLPVRTFTSVSLYKKMHFEKGKNINSYPHYEKSETGYLKRKMDGDLKGAFIPRQTNGEKNVVTFFQYKNLRLFEESKIGILSKVLSVFKRRYGDIFEVCFDEITDYINYEHKSKHTKNEEEYFNSLCSSMNVGVLDFVKSETSTEMSERIIYQLSKKGCYTRATNNKSDYNIAIIHEKDFYKENDIHDAIHIDKTLQCITVENYIKTKGKNLESEIKTILHELVIKQDLKDKKISIYKWDECGYANSWKFIYKVDNETEKYLMMEIKPDGCFEISEIELNLFASQEYSKYAEAFSDGKDVKGLVEDDKGNINIIEDSKAFTLPKFERIEQELKNGNNKLRNKEKRDELLNSILDVKYYEKEGEYRYFVGMAQDKMQYSSATSSIIRTVKKYNNSEEIFSSLLNMMSVLFVKNGQLTVMPFPFKYLREYCRNYENSSL